MTEHRVPVEGQDQGVVTLHSKSDTIVTTADVELALDGFGFGRLSVRWRRWVARCAHGTPWDQICQPCAAGPVSIDGTRLDGAGVPY